MKFPWTSILKIPVVANTVADLGEIQFPLMLIVGNQMIAPRIRYK
jgi:hypothetical protein